MRKNNDKKALGSARLPAIQKEVRQRLAVLADEKYRAFHSGLVPGQNDILGVRIPKMRLFAKDIAKNGLPLPGEETPADWQEYLAAARLQEGPCYEETLLQGFVTGYAKMPFPQLLERIAAFVPKIDNWAACDTFCGTLKATDRHMEEMWDFLTLYLALGACDYGSEEGFGEANADQSQAAGPIKTICGEADADQRLAAGYSEAASGGGPNLFAAGYSEAASFPYMRLPSPQDQDAAEFPVRFAVVMLLSYYIKEDYIDAVLLRLDSIRHPGYYVRMATAWALSVCFVKFPDKTMAFFQDNHLDDFTYNKALQKTIESFRVDKATKDRLRSMKRK